ncbi:MAG: FemAB family PEP-CTERM system-associated protein [Burkholderiales bacterium]|nr:FemAB family PEP-CTERM system-associated protein [Burkholderiales bacterium]
MRAQVDGPGRVAVRAFTAADAPAWNRYVERAANATFFHRLGWRDIIEDEFGHRTHYLVAERGGEIAGVLPLAEVRSRIFGHAMVSLPFCVYGGPVADDAEAEAALIGEAERRACAVGAAHLELRNRRSLRPDWPRQDLYVTFRRPISADAEENMLAIPRKQRAMIRKGIKHGLRSEVDRGVDRFFDLYADNVHRHGTPPFSKRYFARLREVFGDDCEAMTVVDGGGRQVSGVISFYFRNEVLPYYAGDSVAARELAANDFKYWELMRRACERGITVFDYGRSKRGTGSFDFKKNWGFEPAPLAYEYALFRGDAIPQNNPANPKYRAMIALWRRLPRGVANAIGPHIVRGLG